MSADMSDTVK